MSEMADLKAPTGADYAMLGALVLIWGTTFLMVKVALTEATPMLVAAARVIIAAMAVIPYALLTGRKLPHGRGRWLGALAMALFSLSLPFSLLAWAQQVVPSGVAGIYMAVIPLLTLPLAHAFSPGETMTRRKAAGFLVGFVGVLFLIGWEALSALGSADGMAQLACLGAALSYAIGSILTRRTPPMDPIVFAALGLAIGTVLILPFGVTAWPQQGFSTDVWMVLLFIGLISTGIPVILRVKVITSAGSVFMSSVGYLVPITALTVGVLFGGETLHPFDLLACALILGGLAIAQRKKPLKALP